MSAYWWECESCGNRTEFSEACGSQGMAHFIWDVLLEDSWDQRKLLLKCHHCGNVSLRITYEFPRQDKETLRVIHIVGLDPKDTYIPMIWEVYPIYDKEEHWFDFKYVNGRNIYGLNKPAVFSRQDLKQLFSLYGGKTGVADFP